MAANEIPIARYQCKLLNRVEVAEGTMAFHFEKPARFDFKPGQSADLTLSSPPETDAEGNTRTFSIASPPFENHLMFTTRMRDTAFKRSLKKVVFKGRTGNRKSARVALSVSFWRAGECQVGRLSRLEIESRWFLEMEGH